ncbi:MAG: AAA family ATPase [Planctomycetota bacterium]|nr:AAA family ATPase [Planctomycetota bacterium]
MISRIELTNFMSHTSTVIEPAPGLTVFVGPNNCGKSAVFSALECTLRRITGGHMKRHESSSCTVAVTLSDGTHLGFRRGASSSTLTLNDESGIGYDAEGCARIASAAKMPAADVAVDVHFGAQKEPLFLVNEAESVVAKFFASSSDAGKLLEMKRRLAARQQEDQKALTRTKAQIAARESRLAALAPVPQIEESLKAVRTLRDALGEEQAAIQQLMQRLDQLAAAERDVGFIVAQHAAMASLQMPPVLHDDAAAERVIIRLAQVSATFDAQTAQLAVLHTVVGPPSLDDEVSLAQCVHDLGDAAAVQKHTHAEHAVLAQLSPLPTLHDTVPLERVATNLGSSIHTAERAVAEGAILLLLQKPPEEADGQTLVRVGKELKAASVSVQDATRLHAETEAQLAAAAEALDAAKERLGTCPMCDRPFSSGAHEHGGAA